MRYVYLTNVPNKGQAALLESLLISEGIRYMVQGDSPGRRSFIAGLSDISIYVHPRDANRARLIAADFIKGYETGNISSGITDVKRFYAIISLLSLVIFIAMMLIRSC